MPQTDTKRKPRKPKKNRSLEVMRSLTDQLAKGLRLTTPGARELSDDDFARPVSGFLSQWAGRNPDTGEIVDPMHENFRRSLEGVGRMFRGQSTKDIKPVFPGIIHDTLSLPNILGTGPQWSKNAEEEANDIHTGVQDSLSLDAPTGFKENLLEGAGVMAGQIPMPAKAATAPLQLGKGALNLAKHYGKKFVTSPVEYLMPTVNPKFENYAAGAMFPGVMGGVAENAEPIVRGVHAELNPDEIPMDPRIQGGALQFMRKQQEDAERMRWLREVSRYELPDLNPEDVPPDMDYENLAEGGKVGALKGALEALNAGMPKPGMFSVMDSLIEEAPFNKATGEQWKSYLKPGREHIREDVRFPLRSEELRWGGDAFDQLMASGESVTKEDLLKALRRGRPQFSLETRGPRKRTNSVADRELMDKAVSHTIDTQGVEAVPGVKDLGEGYHHYANPLISHGGDAQYDSPNWRSPGGTGYREWITGSPQVTYPSHFDYDTISWSRIQDLPLDGEHGFPENVRLIDELQSDLHQAATYRFPGEKKRLGYANPLGQRLKGMELEDRYHGALTEYAVDEFNRAKGRPKGSAMLPEEESEFIDFQEHLIDTHSPPGGGQPYESPFMGDAWIRHELQKNLAEAVDQGDAGLAVVHPENVANRYTDNPGLGKFYEVSVVPELEKLAQRYGARMGTYDARPMDPNEFSEVQRTWKTLSRDLKEIESQFTARDVNQDEDFSAIAEDIIMEVEESGFDPDLISDADWKTLRMAQEDPTSVHPFEVHGVIRRIRGHVNQALKTKTFENSQKPHPMMELTPELREKIKRVGVPLYTTGALALSGLLDLPEEEQQYADGGKVGALKQALKGLTITPFANAKRESKAYQIGDPVEEILQATNEGVARGVVSEAEKAEIQAQLAANDEHALVESLLKLHEKLYPTPRINEVNQSVNLSPTPRAPSAHGKMTQEEWERTIGIRKSRGGRTR